MLERRADAPCGQWKGLRARDADRGECVLPHSCRAGRGYYQGARLGRVGVLLRISFIVTAVVSLFHCTYREKCKVTEA